MPATWGAAKELPVATIVVPAIQATGTSMPRAPHSAGGSGFASNRSGSSVVIAATENTDANSAGMLSFVSFASAHTTMIRRRSA